MVAAHPAITTEPSLVNLTVIHPFADETTPGDVPEYVPISGEAVELPAYMYT